MKKTKAFAKLLLGGCEQVALTVFPISWVRSGNLSQQLWQWKILQATQPTEIVNNF